MKHELIIQKKYVYLVIAFLVIFVFGYAYMKNKHPEVYAESQENDLSVEPIIASGLEAFFSPDFQKGYEAWVSAFCQVSSESGCRILKEVYGPPFWTFIDSHQFTTTCKVEVQQAVEVGDDYQIWRALASFSKPFPNQSTTRIVYAMITLQPDTGWAFERVLTDQEGELYE